jgi:hypothetical protein
MTYRGSFRAPLGNKSPRYFECPERSEAINADAHFIPAAVRRDSSKRCIPDELRERLAPFAGPSQRAR